MTTHHHNGNSAHRKTAKASSVHPGKSPSDRPWLENIGGESLDGSGFEDEDPAPDFGPDFENFENTSSKFRHRAQGGLQ